MSEAERLLPCPFCGGAAAVKDWHYSGTGASGMETPHPFTACTQCGCKLPKVACDDWPYGRKNGALTYEQAKAQAITAWNTRALSARIAALEEALRGVMEDWHAQGCYALHPFTDGAECDCGADKARNAARKALGKGSE